MRRMRERRAAGLLPADGEPPRPRDELLLPSVRETLDALALGERDQGAARLALAYARTIDQASNQAWALRWIGPHLLDILTSLHATPASRPAQKPAGPSAPSQLDRLREKRSVVRRPL
jgi:hypothetical protein